MTVPVWSELRFATRAWLVAPAVELGLAWAGLHRTLRWIERTAPVHGPAPEGRGSVDAARGARLVDRAYRLHLVRGQCLPRALVQYWLHRRDGTAVRFILGVRKASRTTDAEPQGDRRETIEAHAWVEPLEDEAAAPTAAGGEGFEVLLVREADPSRRGAAT
ncbi:MAG: lasso peptide biosynthesis B2 protein [Deltaproteobacteria bacterium]|jgi:hypothetical protein|nr:lasso peptide biosynthesis B2 protein [Deltaproteobacteria bacterium]MBW2535209.1 lasso peptide biosynthesis B2 protein [Deltaproteobacteria bacterium]